MANPYQPDWEQAMAQGMGITTYPGSPAAMAQPGYQDPTAQAAAALTAQQVQQTPYAAKRSQVTSQGAGSPGTMRTPGVGGSPTAAMQGSRGGQAASSTGFPMPHSTSREWFGGLDEYGSTAAASSPNIFWDLYGSQQLGLEPGSMAGQFYAENYNPFAMSAALGYGSQANSYDERLAAGTSLGNLLSKPGTAFFDPGSMVSNVLSAIANPGNNEEFNQLSAIILGASTPDQQLSNLVNFLGEALSGAMPPDVLSAYLAYVQKIGMGIVTKAMEGGIAGFEKGGQNIATYLLQALGPTGGL